MNKQELIKQLSFSLIDCPSDRWDEGYNSALKYVMNFVQQLDEPKITDEQAWNKIAEAYPESVQSLRNTLDNAVFSHKDEPKKVIVPLPCKVVDVIEKLESEDAGIAEIYERFDEMDFYENEDVYTWFMQAGNPDILMKALVNGYEVEKEPRWVIKVGNMYFINWGEDGCTPSFVLNDILGQENEIPKWFSKESADKIAKQLGGTAEWWED